MIPLDVDANICAAYSFGGPPDDDYLLSEAKPLKCGSLPPPLNMHKTEGGRKLPKARLYFRVGEEPET
jgi:hypothetical protein